MSVFHSLDFESSEGRKFRAFVERRLEEHRTKLEDVGMSEADTQAVRGAIRELRAILRPAPPTVSTPRYSGMQFKQRGDQ